MKEVPIWEKSNLTVDEAVAYFNIGENKIREMLLMPNCSFLLMNGNKRLIKRKKLEEHLDRIDTL